MSNKISQLVDTLLKKMTIKEKVGQMTQVTLDMVLKGNVYEPEKPFAFDEKKQTMAMHFDIGEELTHSDGAFVQGGFITAMLDTSMAHLLIFKTNGEYNPLTLNINVNFIHFQD